MSIVAICTPSSSWFAPSLEIVWEVEYLDYLEALYDSCPERYFEPEWFERLRVKMEACKERIAALEAQL